jgi:hypothetical protein
MHEHAHSSQVAPHYLDTSEITTFEPAKNSPGYVFLSQQLAKVGLQASVDNVIGGAQAEHKSDWRSRRAARLSSNLKSDWRAELSMNPRDKYSERKISTGFGWPYLHPGDDELPAKFCWENVTSTAAAAKQPPIPGNKIVMLCGDGDSSIGEHHRDLTLSKQLYAQRHGYKFVYKVIARFVDFWPDDFLFYKRYLGFNETGRDGINAEAAVFLTEGTHGGNSFKHAMSKVAMVLQALYENPDAEWLMWMDGDTWINPLWYDLKAEDYVADVSDDKVFVHENYFSLTSGVLFVRGGERGRSFVMDWLATATSGRVQCHGFDQAALQVRNRTLHIHTQPEISRISLTLFAIFLCATFHLSAGAICVDGGSTRRL